MRKLKDIYTNLPAGLKATLWYTFCSLMQKGINIIVIPVYTRLLTSAEYGSYSVFMSWAEIFEILATFRLFYGAYTVGLVRFSDDRKRYTSSLEKLTALITTAALILYLVFQRQVNAMTGLSTGLTLTMFLMLYAIPVIGFWKTLQRVDNLYKGVVILTACIAVLTPVTGVLGILLVRASAVSVIAARAGIEVLAALSVLVISREYFRERPDKQYCRYAMKISLPLIPFYLSAIVLNHSDRIIIAQLAGSSEAGIYSVAYSAAMIMLLFNTAFDQSLQPWLFKKLKSKDYSGIPRVTTLSVLVVAVLNLLLIALAPEAVFVLAPSEYHEAVWIIPPLAASVYVMFFYQRFINTEFYFSESRVTSAASVGAAIINIALNFALIPRFGYLAAGYTTLFSYIVFWITHYLYFRRICKKNDCPLSILDMRSLMGITAAFFGMTALLAAGYERPAIRFAFIGIMAAAAIYKRKAIGKAAKELLRKKDI